MAACCLGILSKLETDNEYRRKIRKWYLDDLKNVKNIRFIEHENEEYTSGHLAQVIMERAKNSDDRNRIIGMLNNDGIYPGVHYRPLSKSSYYESKGQECKQSREISSKIISLPCHMGITREDVKRVCDALRKYA